MEEKEEEQEGTLLHFEGEGDAKVHCIVSLLIENEGIGRSYWIFFGYGMDFIFVGIGSLLWYKVSFDR